LIKKAFQNIEPVKNHGSNHGNPFFKTFDYTHFALGILLLFRRNLMLAAQKSIYYRPNYFKHYIL